MVCLPGSSRPSAASEGASCPPPSGVWWWELSPSCSDSALRSHMLNFLAVQWLGPCALTAGPWVWSLVRELSSCKLALLLYWYSQDWWAGLGRQGWRRFLTNCICSGQAF